MSDKTLADRLRKIVNDKDMHGVPFILKDAHRRELADIASALEERAEHGRNIVTDEARDDVRAERGEPRCGLCGEPVPTSGHMCLEPAPTGPNGFLRRFVDALQAGHTLTEQDAATLRRVSLALAMGEKHHHQARAAAGETADE